ncbi:hypothetical protein [Candidatus Entotheonella palauensis]|uniref:hypothetical protein n=1 Tax=Candidatus Entotheonella palauensis TaxID=93172 RepID=UPI00117757B9|nr:hypothetical protein [Candidatus Entotheonella palauensis]
MQDMHPDSEPENDCEIDMFRFAQQVAQQAPECRESRIADAQRALNDHHLMLNAEVLASRILVDPLHQAHCDVSPQK